MNRLWRVQFAKTSREGRWHLALWIQVDQIALMGLRLRLKRTVGLTLGWLRSVLIFPLWISFELPTALWNELERRASSSWSIRLRGWHRFLFCIVLSLTGVQVGLLLLAGVQLAAWTVLLSAGHGLALHLLWRKAARWGGQIMGARPVLYADDQEAFANLDF